MDFMIAEFAKPDLRDRTTPESLNKHPSDLSSELRDMVVSARMPWTCSVRTFVSDASLNQDVFFMPVLLWETKRLEQRKPDEEEGVPVTFWSRATRERGNCCRTLAYNKKDPLW
jgi:hypothetical protein